MRQYLWRVGKSKMTKRGFTLIEMMVTVSLMLILTATAVVKLQMSKDSRRAREASRLIVMYLGSARNRAMANGRCVGVRFKCLTVGGTGTNSTATIAPCSMNADQCEVPPPYCGDVETATVQLFEYARDSNYAYLDIFLFQALLPRIKIHPPACSAILTQ
jgi:prepilin-type N-terminal cleavage/methylation domain-containing protein